MSAKTITSTTPSDHNARLARLRSRTTDRQHQIDHHQPSSCSRKMTCTDNTRELNISALASGRILPDQSRQQEKEQQGQHPRTSLRLQSSRPPRRPDSPIMSRGRRGSMKWRFGQVAIWGHAALVRGKGSTGIGIIGGGGCSSIGRMRRIADEDGNDRDELEDDDDDDDDSFDGEYIRKECFEFDDEREEVRREVRKSIGWIGDGDDHSNKGKEWGGQKRMMRNETTLGRENDPTSSRAFVSKYCTGNSSSHNAVKSKFIRCRSLSSATFRKSANYTSFSRRKWSLTDVGKKKTTPEKRSSQADKSTHFNDKENIGSSNNYGSKVLRTQQSHRRHTRLADFDNIDVNAMAAIVSGRRSIGRYRRSKSMTLGSRGGTAK